MTRFRKTLPIGLWPDAIRAAWTRVEAAWSTPRSARDAYGRLLRFLYDRKLSLDATLTPELADEFLAQLRSSQSAGHTLTIFERLFYIMRAVHPTGNWSWLRKRFLILRHELRPPAPTARHRPKERRITVPFEQWPIEHQSRWRQAIAKADPEDFLSEDGGRFAHWTTATCGIATNGYGRFLHTVRAAGRGDEVTPHSVRYLVAAMHDKGKGLRARTIRTAVRGVYNVMRAVEPGRNWAWLRATCKNLKRYASGSSSRKHGRIVDPGELWILGYELMAKAQQLRDDDYWAAVMFRNGLLLAMISCIPVRLRTIALTEIGTHLDLDSGTLKYGSADTKEAAVDFREIPAELLSMVRLYIAVYRDRFVRNPDCRALWISDQGGRLTAGAISEVIGDITETALGLRISPHLIRDCVATAIKENHPEETEIGSIILNHANRATTAFYQAEARQLVAQRRMRAIAARYASDRGGRPNTVPRPRRNTVSGHGAARWHRSNAEG